jgi:hypothetical protein
MNGTKILFFLQFRSSNLSPTIIIDYRLPVDIVHSAIPIIQSSPTIIIDYRLPVVINIDYRLPRVRK